MGSWQSFSSFGQSDAAALAADARSQRPQSRPGPLVAVAIGVLAAVLVAKIGSAHDAVRSFDGPAPDRGSSAAMADLHELDRMKPQKQAEDLLELAIAQSEGAADQISTRVNRWQGKLRWNSQIATLTTAALNSNDMRVRESGVEIELAAYGLGKNSVSLDYLLRTSKSSDHAHRIWALWALGLMANRGVKSEQVTQVLTAHLKDSDEESRRWAVEGLALVGTSGTIDSLLKAMRDDPSPRVRERAACGVAQSGMFTRELRLAAVPQLLRYTDDPAIDAQTHAWAFQALAGITGQRLPSDSAVWRAWYSAQN
jgi:HEAT repeat protein